MPRGSLRQQPDHRSSPEQYAYLFNAEQIEVVDPGGIFPDGEHDLFQREPFVARFRARHGGETFALITVHTAPDAAVAEISALDAVFTWAQQRWPDETEVFALGDFNASCNYATPAHLDQLAIRGAGYSWIVPDDADTNVSQNVCAYDRVVATPDGAAMYAVRWGVENTAFDPAQVDLSDHWPVWIAVRARAH